MIYFNKIDKFSSFRKHDLKDYTRFKTVILDFKEFYKLDDIRLMSRLTGTSGSWGKNIFHENIRGGALMTSYNIVAETNISTVVSEYIPEKTRRKEYQSEAELEQELIENLGSQGIPYLNIHNEKDLILNLREQLEKLNKYQLQITNGTGSFPM